MEATPWIALVALGFTGAQAWIAHRKLRFDLFDKRFEAWSAMNDAINEYRKHIESSTYRKENSVDLEMLKRIWNAERSLKLLFPNDVADRIKEVNEKILDYQSAKSNLVDRPDEDDGRDLYQKYIEAESKLRLSQNMLMNEANYYIVQYGPAEKLSVYVRRKIAIWRAPRDND